MNLQSNKEIVVTYLDAIARGDVAGMAAILDEDVRQTEHPNLLKPAGALRGRDDLCRDLERSGSVIRSQRYEIANLAAEGDVVHLAARWVGVLAMPLGKLAAGDEMSCQTSMLFRLEQGRIVEQQNFDCFADFR